MQSKVMPQTRQMPNRLIRFSLGLLILLLTLFLIVTAVDPSLDDLFIEETCTANADETFTTFSAETAVPDCWLVP
ncbi:MAG: hypothetical protein H6656_01520 [Ardenticatenaceae bacterium]|nr:hypothetical protein [Anaerolineales bacterium]MCB9006066.1 hypothetical protein [Ardenticatenaceae bacterium]